MAALQAGDTVLITGGIGWGESQIVKAVLKAGLKPKLMVKRVWEETTRTEVDKCFEKGTVEIVLVDDFEQESSLKEALRDVHGVIYTTPDLASSGEASQVVPLFLQSYTNLLNAVNTQQTVQRLILTMPSVVLGFPNEGGNTEQHFTVDSWNDDAVEKSKTISDGKNNWAASKVICERAAWEFIKTKNRHFTLNTIIHAGGMFGEPVPDSRVTSLGQAVIYTAQGDVEDLALARLGSQYHIDVDDVAVLHVLALTNEDVQSERILAFATRYTFNDILDVIKRVKPDAPIVEKRKEWGIQDNTTVDVNRASQLLQSQGGLHDLEYSIRRNVC